MTVSGSACLAALAHRLTGLHRAHPGPSLSAAISCMAHRKQTFWLTGTQRAQLSQAGSECHCSLGRGMGICESSKWEGRGGGLSMLCRM